METPNTNTGQGQLSVRVISGNGAFPVENAYVYIREYKEGAPILYSLRTNADGFTEAVPLATPPRVDSLSPSVIIPYSEYVVTVKKDGFYTSENIGLPMFDGVTSIQKVNLLPLTEEDLLSGKEPRQEFYESGGYEALRGVDGAGERRGEQP